MRFFFHWQTDEKTAAMTWFGFKPYFATDILHYFFTNGQSDAGPLVFISCVQSIKHFENLFMILFINTDSVVFYSYKVLVSLFFVGNDDSSLFFLVVFYSICDHVLQQL